MPLADVKQTSLPTTLKKLKEKKMNLLDIFEGREPYQQAIDKLEQRRIDDLAMKMDDLVARAKDPEYKKNPAALSALMKEFQKCKAERDSYYKIKEGEVTRTATGIKHRGTYGTEYSKSGVEFAKQKHHADLNKVDKTLTKNLEKGMDIKIDEGSMKQWLWNEAERMDRDAFIANAAEYGMSDQEAAEWWDDINGVDESGIGQDIVNKTEKMARATPQTKTGAVASTVKNAAKWLAGQGGPGKEGPTYEGAEDIEDRGEYDREGDMAKDNIHTIVRNARELESILGDNDNLPEWVQDKLANIKGMMTAVSEYMQTQHEREGVVPEGTETQWSKQSPWTKIPKSKSGQPVDPRGEVTHLSDVARRQAERNAQAQKKSSKEVKGVAETVSDPRAGMARIYRELAPKIERYKDSFLAGQLYDELENYAELHGAEREFKQMMATARGRAHMEYDTNPGGFHNWFWFLPFADEGVAEGWSDAMVAQRTGRPRTPYSIFIKGRKWKDFESDDHAEAVANKLRAKFEREGRDPKTITIAPTDYDQPIKEDQDTSGVESAIIRRIMVAHTDLLMKFGPDKVMQAAEEVAYNVGDVDEIGTSDVSAYVAQVKQILGATP